MLLSKGHHFIFIKTKKTAGTSVEMLLSRWMTDPGDIITPISPEDEAVRQRAGVVPKNFLAEDGSKRFWNHITAAEIQARAPSSVWDQSLKITIERHPYEKAVSLAYFHFARDQSQESFSDYLDRVVRDGDYRNYDRYAINGKIAADIVLRYEHLDQDVQALLERLSLPAANELPRAKAHFRRDPRAAREILSDPQKQFIRDYCKEEFVVFGYEE